MHRYSLLLQLPSTICHLPHPSKNGNPERRRIHVLPSLARRMPASRATQHPRHRIAARASVSLTAAQPSPRGCADGAGSHEEEVGAATKLYRMPPPRLEYLRPASASVPCRLVHYPSSSSQHEPSYRGRFGLVHNRCSRLGIPSLRLW